MPLLANSRLGPYEIKSTLGVGGMGEVYRARDSRLNRDVAIKVLRQDSASGASAELRSRFEREARAVAALNHTNIIAVYDFGVEDGKQYIVSELLEGESLRSLLKGKPVPVRRLIEIAAQVADGLAAAHAAGIVHRDLKPENIMIAKDGRVKILDFGLARQARAASSDETSAPDSDRNLTNAGTILGTASYMSPEQALGKDVDYRSDQFSFGLILHEMTSGKQAFARGSSVEVMAAIVRDEPSIIEEKIPAPLKWIIDRCLAKEPEQRYESTRDLYRELKNLRDHFSEAYTSGALAPVAAAQINERSWKIPAIFTGCLLLAALLGYLLRPTGQDISKYRYTPFASHAFGPIWSPDGKAVAYTGKTEGGYQVFLRYLNSPIPVQLTHEQHTVGPLGWSSDRSHLLFIESTDKTEPPYDKLYSVATVGGEPELIMDADCIGICDLSKDGKAFASVSKGPDGRYGVVVSDPVGSVFQSYKPDPFATKDIYNSPSLAFSPDGKKILFLLTAENNTNQAWLLPYPAGSGTPKLVLKKLPTLQGTPSFQWMPDSRHIAIGLANTQDSPPHLWIADVDSDDLTQLTTGTSDDAYPVPSPDGQSILYSQITSQFDLISASVEDGSTRTLTNTGRAETMAAWSTKQSKLAWVTNRSGPFEIWVRSADGSDRPVVTAADFPPGTNKWFMDPSLSPDGERLVFVRIDKSGIGRLWISSLSGGAPVRLTNAEPSMEFGGSWSPDGSRFVYIQVQAGKNSLMMARTSGGAAPVVVKADIESNDLPDWSPSGDWITYRDKNGWNLISPDGKNTRLLGKIQTAYLAFSRDGKLLYGIETGATAATKDRATLFSLDPMTLKRKDIKELGKDFRPASNLHPGIRFSLAPDGKSFVYSTAKYRDDLWMLTGYRQPGLWNQIKDALRLSSTK